MSLRLALKKSLAPDGQAPGDVSPAASSKVGAAPDDEGAHESGSACGKRQRLATGASPNPGRSAGTQPRPMTQWLPFGEALAVAQSLGLASREEWKAWSKEGRRPPNVPSHPDGTYKDGGWQGWGHWLGTASASRRGGTASQRPPSAEARPRPQPRCKGWQGMEHWLGAAANTGTASKDGASPVPPPRKGGSDSATKAKAKGSRTGDRGQTGKSSHPGEGSRARKRARET